MKLSFQDINFWLIKKKWEVKSLIMIFRAHTKIYCQGSPKKHSVSPADQKPQGKLMWWLICKNVPRGVKSSLGDLLTLFQKWWRTEGPSYFLTKMTQCEDKWEDTEKESIWFSIREITWTAWDDEDWDSVQCEEKHQMLFAMRAQAVCLLIKVSLLHQGV